MENGGMENCFPERLVLLFLARPVESLLNIPAERERPALLVEQIIDEVLIVQNIPRLPAIGLLEPLSQTVPDRKSTRLNSSHQD